MQTRSHGGFLVRIMSGCGEVSGGEKEEDKSANRRHELDWAVAALSNNRQQA